MIQAEVKMSCRMIQPVAEMPEECLGSWAGRSCIAEQFPRYLKLKHF